MTRRKFLSRALGAALAPLASRAALAQHAGHGMPDMPGMGHSMHGGMAPAAPAGLAAADALPSGAPLAGLHRLSNAGTEPGVLRATLVARVTPRELMPGRPTALWQYLDGGAAPQSSAVGPLIEAREGDTVEIRFVNQLAQPSTIHWHGLPVPPEQDGNPADMVAPGATRIYRYTLPAGSAGTYWYHPHPHRMTAEQVFRGLAGPFIVRAADDPLAAWPERHLFFSDLKLGGDGAVAPNDAMDWMNGREGQFVLVNGALRPVIQAAGGERWRLWNACSARYLRLAFGDGRAFAQAGTDGGLLERPLAGLTELLLAPGERAEILVHADPRGSAAALVALAYERGKMTMDPGQSLPAETDRVLAAVNFAPAQDARPEPSLPARLREIPPLGEPAARKSLTLSEAMDMQAPGGMKFMINDAVFDPRRADLTSQRGQVEHWSITNGTDMDHPFHLHGTQFQVLDSQRDGPAVPAPYRAWRDTVNLRPGETVRIATAQLLPGERMFHCHILEHEDLGMMGVLRVV
jgi:bilirubin oxidase